MKTKNIIISLSDIGYLQFNKSYELSNNVKFQIHYSECILYGQCFESHPDYPIYEGKKEYDHSFLY